MKTLKCDLCDHEVSGETFEEWMDVLKPHYIEKHSDFMQKNADKSEDDQKAEMGKWMTENKTRFEAV